MLRLRPAKQQAAVARRPTRLRQNAQPLRIRHLVREKVRAREGPPLQALLRVPFGENANLLTDAFRGQLVVAGDDDDPNARVLAALDRLPHLRPWGILQSTQTHKAELALEVSVAADVSQLVVGGVAAAPVVAREVAEGPGVVLERHGEAPQRLLRHGLNRVGNFLPHLLREEHAAPVRPHEVRAARQHRLGGALHHQHVLVLPRGRIQVADQHTHALPVSAELQERPLAVVGRKVVIPGQEASLRKVARVVGALNPAQLLHQNLERRLRGRPHGSEARRGSRHLRPGICTALLRGGRCTLHAGFVAQGTDGHEVDPGVVRGAHGGACQDLPAGRVVAVAADLAARQQRGARGGRIRIQCRRIGCHDFHTGHLVARQRARLVRADHRGAPERLHRGQLPHDGLLFRHLARAESQAGRDHRRKALRNRSHSQGHRNLKVVRALVHVESHGEGFGRSQDADCEEGLLLGRSSGGRGALLQRKGEKVLVVDGPNDEADDADQL
mmetsp:Transcript_3273/g.7241  ORF Transcript_3273/g.7241 Transcript_3273/m.7241 type:complete len:500 (-) Transcript_3273:205-1704(-)